MPPPFNDDIGSGGTRSSEADTQGRVTILYSDGAEDIWELPIDFNLSTRRYFEEIKRNSTKKSSGSSGSSSSVNFTPNVTLAETPENTLEVMNALLIRKDDYLLVKLVIERRPYLTCLPETKEDLNDEPFKGVFEISVFDGIDEAGNVKVKTYNETISIIVFREIFENSTIALAVGLFIGLALAFIAAIVFCVQFFRMKNKY